MNRPTDATTPVDAPPEVVTVTNLVATAVKNAQGFDAALEAEAARVNRDAPFADPRKVADHLEAWAKNADTQRRADLRAARDVADELLRATQADAARQEVLGSTLDEVEASGQETLQGRLLGQLVDAVTEGNVAAWLSRASLEDVKSWYANASDTRDRARLREVEAAVLGGWTPANFDPTRVVELHDFRGHVKARRAGRVSPTTRAAISQLEAARRSAGTWAGVVDAIPVMDGGHVESILRRRAQEAGR